MKNFALTPGLFALVACAHTPAPLPDVNAGHPAETAVITLDRGGDIFGHAPSYRIEIHGDGTAIFDGHGETATLGTKQYSIAPADVAGLMEFMKARRFWSLNDKYQANWTDQIWKQVCVIEGTAKKCVEDYAGEVVGMPHTVHEIEEEIDRVAQTTPLIKGS